MFGIVADAESRGPVDAWLLGSDELERSTGVGRPKSSSKEVKVGEVMFGGAVVRIGCFTTAFHDPMRTIVELGRGSASRSKQRVEVKKQAEAQECALVI